MNKLPERWHIVLNSDTIAIVGPYYDKKCASTCYARNQAGWKYLRSHTSRGVSITSHEDICNADFAEYADWHNENSVEISLEDFKNLVLNPFPEKWYINIEKLSSEECDIVAAYYREMLNGDNCYDKLSRYWKSISSHNDLNESIIDAKYNGVRPGLSFGSSYHGVEISFAEFDKNILNNTHSSMKIILGYLAPINMFGGKVLKDTMYMYVVNSDNYYPVSAYYSPANENSSVINDNEMCCLPKEIVEQWEPVYREENVQFELGEIVVVTKEITNNKAFIGYIGKLDSIDKLYYSVDNSWCLDIRKPTEAEIQQYLDNELLVEVKKRYPVGTIFLPVHIDNPSKSKRCIVTNDNFVIGNRQGHDVAITSLTDEGRDFDTDGLAKYGNTAYDRILYADGKWAEIVPSCPSIIINGYTGEFFDTHVEFGCAQISKEIIYSIRKLMNESDDNSNRYVNSVTYGSGTFTKTDIEKMVEYYNDIDGKLPF